MTTIAKTKRYIELNYRHRKLVQLYSVMSELRLHTNKAIDPYTAKYYHTKLYTWGDSGAFLTASLESMMQTFYVELDGFVGAYWDSVKGCTQLRKNEQGSLPSYLYDATRKKRKNSAKSAFEVFLKKQAVELEMIHNIRGKLAHFKELNKRAKTLVPGDIKIREILNELADVIHLLGYQRGNKPNYIEKDSDSTLSVQSSIDKLVRPDRDATKMRDTYIKARSKWFK